MNFEITFEGNTASQGEDYGYGCDMSSDVGYRLQDHVDTAVQGWQFTDVYTGRDWLDISDEGKGHFK